MTSTESHFQCCGEDGEVGLHLPGCPFNGKVRHMTSTDGTTTARAHVAANLSAESEAALQSLVDAAAADMGHESRQQETGRECPGCRDRIEYCRAEPCTTGAAVAEAEARIVAWLRLNQGPHMTEWPSTSPSAGWLADAIERGEHRA